MAVLGLGGTFLSTVPASVVGDVMTGKGGRVIGLSQMASDAGMIVGPLVVGYISDIISIRAAFFATAIVFLIALVISFRLPETRNIEEGPTQSADPSGVSSSVNGSCAEWMASADFKVKPDYCHHEAKSSTPRFLFWNPCFNSLSNLIEIEDREETCKCYTSCCNQKSAATAAKSRNKDRYYCKQ
jgi:MFS family permease